MILCSLYEGTFSLFWFFFLGFRTLGMDLNESHVAIKQKWKTSREPAYSLKWIFCIINELFMTSVICSLYKSYILEYKQQTKECIKQKVFQDRKIPCMIIGSKKFWTTKTCYFLWFEFWSLLLIYTFTGSDLFYFCFSHSSYRNDTSHALTWVWTDKLTMML